MSTCLVTGGAGFIGSHLVDRLIDAGHTVVVIDNESTGRRGNVHRDAHYIRGDVALIDQLRAAFETPLDVVFHIAGQASIAHSFDAPVDDLTTNVTGTVNVLQLCVERRVPRLLYASSMTVYGRPKRTPVGEEESCEPISYYGITKYAAERYVMATGLRDDLDFPFAVTALRMFNVYGARQRLDNPYQGVLGFFLGCVLRGDPIPVFGDGAQTRDFIHIDDVVEGWMLAWHNPAAQGQVYNLGFGEGVSISALAAAAAEAFDHDPATYPRLSGPLRPGDQRHMAADISLARRQLGWQPQIALGDGLALTATWAKANIDGPPDG